MASGGPGGVRKGSGRGWRAWSSREGEKTFRRDSLHFQGIAGRGGKSCGKSFRKVLTRGSGRVGFSPPHESERRERRESIATRKGPIGFLVPSNEGSFTSMARSQGAQVVHDEVDTSEGAGSVPEKTG